MVEDHIIAILYDLDGTLVDTADLHLTAWITAGEELELHVSQEMLDYQRGKRDNLAARMMLGEREPQLLPEEFESQVSKLAELKDMYVLEKIGDAPLFPGTLEGIKKQKGKGRKIGITTSASRGCTEKILAAHPDLARLVDVVVHREMYDKGKPDPQPLFTTLQMLGNIDPKNAKYVGDALADYLAAQRAGMEFDYYCPKGSTPIEGIPSELRIQDLRDKHS